MILLTKKRNVLCAREYQNSIKESVHSLFKQRIEALGLSKYYEVTREEIRCTYTGSRIIFKGLRNNIDSIKSLAGIDILWIEEADAVSAESWKVIKPTIREENSEIWITMNPKLEKSIMYREFILPDTLPANTKVVTVNWQDNPYFPQVLRDEMERDRARDYGYYLHVWEGHCLKHSDAQVFANKYSVQEFDDDPDAHKYFGLDFGFSQDPTAAIRCYIVGNHLYISHECFQKSLEIDNTGQFLLDNLPDLKGNNIYADNARPEIISYLNNHKYGFGVYAAAKGKGSIEDGISYIRSFDQVIIHPRCTNLIEEFSTHSFIVDGRSGDISNKMEDKNNHGIDALRYGLERIMKRSRVGVYLSAESEFLIDPFQIPRHWQKAYGITIGMCTAATFIAYDKDNDIIYIIGEYSDSELTATQHIAKLMSMGCTWQVGMCDPGVNQSSLSDGQSLFEDYQRAGMNLVKTKCATDLAVGKVLERIRTGQFKVFNTCKKFIDQWRRYSRDDNGKIQKGNYQLMSALEFAILDGYKYATTKELATHGYGRASDYTRNVKPMLV